MDPDAQSEPARRTRTGAGDRDAPSELDLARRDVALAVDDARSITARARGLGHALGGLADRIITPEQQAAQLIGIALDAFGASAAIAARIAADGRTLELVGAARVPDELAREVARVGIDEHNPLSDAVREERGVYCESRASVLHSYPGLERQLTALGAAAVAVMPVRHLGRTQGALALVFGRERTFSPGDRMQLRTLGTRLARALAHARLYFAEQEARALAERALADADLARTEALAARAIAESASRAKSDFLATVSHELRSPLNAIIGYAELLEDGIAGPLSARQHEFLARLRTSSEQLRDLVEQLLSGARGAAGRETLSIGPVSLADVLQQVVSVATPLAERKRIRLTWSLADAPAGDVELRSDAGKLRQILVNLAVNAVKFTDRGSVAVRARATAAAVEVLVEDTGMGIEAANLPRIFEPFWQASQGSGRALGGTGLGLSIARQHAELLGGSLTVESTVGVGTVFTLRVPLEPRAT